MNNCSLIEMEKSVGKLFSLNVAEATVEKRLKTSKFDPFLSAE